MKSGAQGREAFDLQIFLDKAVDVGLKLSKLGCNFDRKKFENLEVSPQNPYRDLKCVIEFLEAAWMRDRETYPNDISSETLKNELLQELQDALYVRPNEDSAHPLFHKMFEEQVRNSPEDHIAIIYENSKPITYGELNARINQLAHHLIELKHKNDWNENTCIGIFFDNTPEAIITIMAIMKAGLAYMPLTNDEDLSCERLASYIDIAKIKHLIVQTEYFTGEFVQFIRNNLPRIIIHSHEVLAGVNENKENPVEHVSREQLAYVMFTSGSSSKPKGVCIEHRGLSNPTRAVAAEFNITPEDKVAWYALPTFDASLLDIMTALYNGATCVIVPHRIRKNYSALHRYLKEHKVTTITLVPSVLNELDSDLPFLKNIITTGEAASAYTLQRWLHADRIILNGYGPTEFTIAYSLWKIMSANAEIYIGKNPIGDYQWHVLGKSSEQNPFPRNPGKAPEGKNGELYLAGNGMARAYADPDTPEQKRFRTIINPDNPEQLIMVYQTGDKACRKDDAMKLGKRLDKQVKFYGKRLNPGGIEAALLKYKHQDEFLFSNAAVQIEFNKHDPFIHAYIKSDTDYQITEKIIRDLHFYLQKQANCYRYLLPSRYSLVEKWPENANGKRKKIIPAEDITVTHHVGHPFKLEAKTEAEKWITDLFHEVLNIPFPEQDEKCLQHQSG